jgi:hypothetical protein
MICGRHKVLCLVLVATFLTPVVCSWKYSPFAQTLDSYINVGNDCHGTIEYYNPSKPTVLITKENGVLCEFQIESGHFYEELFHPCESQKKYWVIGLSNLRT